METVLTALIVIVWLQVIWYGLHYARLLARDDDRQK